MALPTASACRWDCTVAAVAATAMPAPPDPNESIGRRFPHRIVLIGKHRFQERCRQSDRQTDGRQGHGGSKPYDILAGVQGLPQNWYGTLPDASQGAQCGPAAQVVFVGKGFFERGKSRLADATQGMADPVSHRKDDVTPAGDRGGRLGPDRLQVVTRIELRIWIARPEQIDEIR